MKTFIYRTMLAVSAFCFTAFVSAQNAASPSDAKPLVKQADGTFVINTTTLAEDVKGYRSTTPLEIYIKSGKIVKVEPLKNQETPKYFVPMKKELLPKFEGLKVKNSFPLSPRTENAGPLPCIFLFLKANSLIRLLSWLGSSVPSLSKAGVITSKGKKLTPNAY